MLRLGLSEKGVTEILAVAEHTVSLTAGAEGLRIPADVPTLSEQPEPPIVGPVSDTDLGDAAASIGEITAWARDHLGISHAPAFWCVLAHQPRFLKATWEKDQLIMSDGELDATAKVCVSLAVSMFRQSDYWTRYRAHQLRHESQMTDAALVELTAAVMHYVSFNTVAHGMRLAAPHSEMTASTFQEPATH